MADRPLPGAEGRRILQCVQGLRFSSCINGVPGLKMCRSLYVNIIIIEVIIQVNLLTSPLSLSSFVPVCVCRSSLYIVLQQ